MSRSPEVGYSPSFLSAYGLQSTSAGARLCEPQQIWKSKRLQVAGAHAGIK